MASPTRWTWVWVNSAGWWRTGRPGMLQSVGLQRVRHDWVIEPNWTDTKSKASSGFWKARSLCLFLVLLFCYSLENQVPVLGGAAKGSGGGVRDPQGPRLGASEPCSVISDRSLVMGHSTLEWRVAAVPSRKQISDFVADSIICAFQSLSCQALFQCFTLVTHNSHPEWALLSLPFYKWGTEKWDDLLGSLSQKQSWSS